MKSLERRYNNISIKNKLLSSYICFAMAVAEQNFAKATIYYWFNRLVDKSDFSRKEKRNLLKHLCNL